MAYQPKSYRKFMAASLSVAMVATAVTPAFAAETKTFSDVPANDAHAANIAKAVELGLIKGFTDGTFKPYTSISRGQVAKVLARSIDPDFNKKEALTDVTPFTDVPATIADSELYKASLVVKKAGVFTGSNGKLNAADPISRQHMAKVLVNAFDLKANDKEVAITDLDQATEEMRTYIKILAQNEVTNVTAYKPTGDVQRAQFASFMIRSIEAKTPIAVAPVITSVSAINSKQILVKFNSAVGTNATDESSYSVNTINTATENVVLGAAVQEDGKSVLLTLEDAYRVSTDVVVAVDGVYVKDSIKDTFPKFATTVTVNDATAPTIVSATAKSNTDEAQAVTVNLSEPITTDAIFKVNGKTVTSVSPITTIEGVDEETVATEYILSGLELVAGKTHTVEIINAEDYAENKATDILSKTFTVDKDTVLATGKVTAVQDNKIKVIFDKAVNEASLSNVAFFTYDAETTTYNNEDVEAPVKADKAGKEWTFELTNAADFYSTNDTTEDVLVKVQAGVIDTTGNAVKPFDATVKLTEDVTGPTLGDITFDKNSKGEVTKLYFHFDELLDEASVDATIADTQVLVKDTTNNQTVLFNALFGAVEAELATDGKTVVATVVDPAATPVKKGSYTFEVQTAANFLVKDSAVGTNENKKVAKTVNFGAVTSQVVVSDVTNTNVTPDEQEFTVTFDKPVTAASAKNPANYIIAGKALPADTEIVVAVDGLSAEFTLPMDYVAETDTDATIVIQNIKPVDSSATFKKYADVIVVTDNTRPTFTTSILNTGAIKLTFSEDVTSDAMLDVADDIAKVKVNGKELDATTYTVADELDVNTGKTVVTITVAASESADHNSTGFSYQYIDVDASGSFNPAIDIELRKATGTTAPASWDNDNDVAKLSLSAVTSVEVVTADEPADITDAEGNTIKSKATIKVK